MDNTEAIKNLKDIEHYNQVFDDVINEIIDDMEANDYEEITDAIDNFNINGFAVNYNYYFANHFEDIFDIFNDYPDQGELQFDEDWSASSLVKKAVEICLDCISSKVR